MAEMRDERLCRITIAAAACMAVLGHVSARAQERPGDTRGADADLAQELTNPIADLVTLPIQMNYDGGLGPMDDGHKLQTNIQPVYPLDLGENWNLITRTIVPVISQNDIFPSAGSQFGLGEITLSLFAVPKRAGAVVWGVGPVLYAPSATDELLGAEKWGAGPTAIALSIRGPWTIGALANHVWSFAGEDSRPDINSSFLQPFVSYTWPSAWTVSVQSETTYNWETSEWGVPVNVAAAKLVKLGKLPVSLQAGVGHWLTSPDSGADGWRFRLQINLVLPKP